MYYFSDNDHKIEHTIEELKNELTKVNLVMKETKCDAVKLEGGKK